MGGFQDSWEAAVKVDCAPARIYRVAKLVWAGPGDDLLLAGESQKAVRQESIKLLNFFKSKGTKSI